MGRTGKRHFKAAAATLALLAVLAIRPVLVRGEEKKLGLLGPWKATALKMSLRMLYANIPALQTLALFDLDGLPTGLLVQAPLKKLDTFLTTSIVINF